MLLNLTHTLISCFAAASKVAFLLQYFAFECPFFLFKMLIYKDFFCVRICLLNYFKWL